MSLLRLAAIAVALLLWGCSSRSSKVDAPRAHRAPSELAEVHFLVVMTGASSYEVRGDLEAARDIIVQALQEAGYRVTVKEEDAHDARLLLQLSANKRSSFMQWQRGGKVMGGYELQARVAVEAEGKIVHSVGSTIRFTEGEIGSEYTKFRELVRKLNGARVMADLGKYVARRKREQLAQAEEQRRAEEQHELQQWRTSALTPCIEASSPTACDALSAWVRMHRDSDERADWLTEAERVLQESKPKIEKRKDEASWLDARQSACIEDATEEACDGVKRYLRDHPEGEHRAEAQAALDNLAKKAGERAAARDAEERRRVATARAEQQRAVESAKAQQAEQARRQARQVCLSQCGHKCGTILDQAEFRNCMAGCTPGCQ